jgi:hypothetical protein
VVYGESRSITDVSFDTQLLPIDQHRGTSGLETVPHRNFVPGRLAKVISLSLASTKY